FDIVKKTSRRVETSGNVVEIGIDATVQRRLPIPSRLLPACEELIRSFTLGMPIWQFRGAMGDGLGHRVRDIPDAKFRQGRLGNKGEELLAQRGVDRIGKIDRKDTRGETA